jgi:TM2 domain-containing membrane protein YozV
MSSSPGAPPTESKRVLCGVLALLLGGFGIHKFVLGHTGAGIVMILLFCVFGISSVIGLIEGIIYLTKSDEEFIRIYQVEKKAWF